MTAIPDVLKLAADWLDPPDDDQGDRELAIRCSKDLRMLIREAWPILEPARPFVGSWHIDCVAEHLMAVSAGEIPRLIVNVPPGSTKSTLAAVMWPSWEWLTSPHIRWIVASYAQDFAYRDSRKMRQLIESRGGKTQGSLFERRGYQGVLALLGQAWRLASDQNAKGRFDTTAGGMRLAASVDGQVTGDHGDRLLVDDPANPKQARSPAEREAANRWWDETMSSRFIDEHAAAVIVMQRLHDVDLTGHLLAREAGWHHLCLPAEYVPGHQFTYPTTVTLPSGRTIDGDPRTEAGELLSPQRLSAAMLAQRRKDLGAFAFAGQYQQQPAPEGGGLFKRGWFEGERVRRWQPGFDRSLVHGWDRVIQSWDMAFKDTKGSDFVVGQLWGFHGADCYLLAQVRGRFDFTTTLHVVKALTTFEATAAATYHAVTAKLVEDKANGTAVINTLRRRIGGLIAIEPQGSKYARASSVAPLSEAGNVILPAADTIPCPSHYVDEAGARHELAPTTVADWVHEHATFPAGAHDDQVDAHSQALTWANPQEREREAVLPEQPPAKGVMDGVMTMRFLPSCI
jgi:predicted phage terminase large subunit-like protein